MTGKHSLPNGTDVWRTVYCTYLECDSHHMYCTWERSSNVLVARAQRDPRKHVGIRRLWPYGNRRDLVTTMAVVRIYQAVRSEVRKAACKII
jgi:hypothetical protein